VLYRRRAEHGTELGLTFESWARGPTDTEAAKCENAECVIHKAISASPALAKRNVQVFAQGSYRNNTNVRLDSDVDVCG
jgi:tRNA nucleotidyltransferase (CCA-adding enzyme)